MFTIRAYDTGEAGAFGHELRFDAGHEVFAAHFPGNPIVPGAVLVEVIRSAASDILQEEMRVVEVRNVKFITVIVPGVDEPLNIVSRYAEKEGTYSFKSVISGGDRIYAKFDLIVGRMN